MNKIISTSVFGTNPRYRVGALKQIQLAKAFYPNWEFRIYTDAENIDFFRESGATVINCSGQGNGTFWRFLPLFESEKNCTIVRDADSRITIREALAVHEWLERGTRAHGIYDHPQHPQIMLLAGLFGIRGALPATALLKMLRYMAAHEYGKDQAYLAEVVFPLVKDDICVHTLNQGWFKSSRLAMANRYTFCGNGYDENDMPVYPPTKEEREGFCTSKLHVSARFNEYPEGE